LRTTRLILGGRIPKLDIACYRRDPALLAHCMPLELMKSLIATSEAYKNRQGKIRMDCLPRKHILIKEERAMIKATSTLIAAVATLALSGGAYAQSNNTLATPSTVSPAAAAPVNSTSGYGTPGTTSSDSGMSTGSTNSGMQSNTNNSSSSLTNLPGSHNTLATPSVVSPAAGQ
jgi:hypothetical protein